MEKICFIINPISGIGKKDAFPEMIRRQMDGSRFETEILFTERRGHAFELAQRQVADGTPYVAAVGGDGTVNEVAAALRDSASAMGIVPCGSGNGLARHLHLPLKPAEALQVINRAHVQAIDYGIANDRPFFCTLGVGFDAHVSDMFARTRKRGFRKYVAIIVREFFRYRAQPYHLVIDGQPLDVTAIVTTVANASQYGNNAYISPLADITDGKLDVCILNPFPKILAPKIALRMLGKTIHKSPYYRTFQCENIVIRRQAASSVHLDGDPFEMDGELNIRIVRGGLKTMIR